MSNFVNMLAWTERKEVRVDRQSQTGGGPALLSLVKDVGAQDILAAVDKFLAEYNV